MKRNFLLLTFSIFVSSFFAAKAAASDAKQMTQINIAGQNVSVVAGGLYERFRSNPPLDVIAEESPDTDLSWFRTLKKTRADIGFASYSPNFYYENTRVSVVYTANLAKLRELMPKDVLKHVQPIAIWPDRGLVVLTAYAYHYCDNDHYNEVALSIVTNKPGASNLGPVSLISEALSKDYWGYVLKLPVNTELAKVRGVLGYNLPKWVTPISFTSDETSFSFEVIDSDTGKTDFILNTEKLKNISMKESFVKNSFINTDQNGRLTTGYSVSRQLKHASSFNASDVRLTLTDGSMSRFLKSLDLGKMIKYEYVPDFQSALYVPRYLEAAKSVN